MREGRAVVAVKWPDDQLSPGTGELLAEGALALEDPGEVLSVVRLGDHA